MNAHEMAFKLTIASSCRYAMGGACGAGLLYEHVAAVAVEPDLRKPRLHAHKHFCKHILVHPHLHTSEDVCHTRCTRIRHAYVGGTHVDDASLLPRSGGALAQTMTRIAPGQPQSHHPSHAAAMRLLRCQGTHMPPTPRITRQTTCMTHHRPTIDRSAKMLRLKN